MKKLIILLLLAPCMILAQKKSDNKKYLKVIATVYKRDSTDPIATLSKFLYHKTDKDTAFQLVYAIWENGHYDKQTNAITMSGKNKMKDFLNLLTEMQVEHNLNEKRVIRQNSNGEILTVFWQGKNLVAQPSQFGRIFGSMNCSNSTIDKLNIF
jgi:hypothetical protein